MHRFVLAAIYLAVVAWIAGCDPKRSTNQDEVFPQNQSGDSSTRHTAEAELPVDNSRRQDGLDAGRVSAAPPTDWQPLYHDPESVVRYAKNDQDLPHIVVQAGYETVEGIDSLTEQNVQQFVQAIAATLEADGKRLIEPVSAMVIGRWPCAAYVSGARLKGRFVDIQWLVTQVAGRRYTIALRARQGELPADERALFAVLAGMRFSTDDEQSPSSEEIESEPATGPAETKGQESQNGCEGSS